MSQLTSQFKIIDKYISEFYPRIHEITSLEEVLVIGAKGYFFFSYGKQSIIAIKRRKKRIFGAGNITYINDGYNIKGIQGFSSLLGSMLSLTHPEFNNVMMEWIKNKHPEIDSVIKLYEFCEANYKNYNDIKHLLENN
jgi:hypothetical protein